MSGPRARHAALIVAGVAALAAAQGCAKGRGEICGRVSDDDGRPAGYVTVTPLPGGSPVETDAQGFFCVPAGPGEVALAVEAPFELCPPDPVKASAGSWVAIGLKRRLSIDSVYQTGFGAGVTLRARMQCGAEASFGWKQVAGPSVQTSAKGWETDTLTFTTHPLAVRSGRPGVISLSPDDAGWYRFSVTASTGGSSVKDEAEVTAASATSGIFSVPVDTDVYLDAGVSGPPGGWKIVKTPPASSAALLPVSTADGKAGVVKMRPDRPGGYTLELEGAGTRITLEAGPWNAAPHDCQRPECHPSEYAGWTLSPHAAALTSRFETPAARPFEKRCLACHTVGYNPGAQSDGFDDMASSLGIFVRHDFPGGEKALPPLLERLANVWCIDCHGPGRLPEHGKRSMTVKAGICGQCHDFPPDYVEMQQWQTTRMAASLKDPTTIAAACSGCHTAQGAVTRIRGRIVQDVPADIAEPVACAVCHLAHTGNPSLLRSIGTVMTADGLLFEAGRGAACIGCHQAGHKIGPEAAALRLAPLAAQSEIQLGGGAYGAKGIPYGINPDLCIDCHMVRKEAPAKAGLVLGGHTFKASWEPMSAPKDCDGDGQVEALDEEVASCLEIAGKAVEAGIGNLPGCAGTKPAQVGLLLLPVKEGGARVAACEAAWFKPASTPLYEAAYDYYLVKRDNSKGAHNPAFTLLLLKRVLERLAGPPTPPGRQM